MVSISTRRIRTKRSKSISVHRLIQKVIAVSIGVLVWSYARYALSSSPASLSHNSQLHDKTASAASSSSSSDYARNTATYIQQLCDKKDRNDDNDKDNWCAPHLSTPEQRRVIFLSGGGRFPTWHEYHSPGAQRLGGESYWAASLQVLLESLNISVLTQREPWGSVEWQKRAIQQDANSKSNQNSTISSTIPPLPYHRIIADCNADYTRQALFHPATMCKVRQLRWFPLKDNEGEGVPCQLSVFRPPLNIQTTWIPFLVHSQVLPKLSSLSQSRQRNNQPPYHAFLLSKDCAFDPELVDGLLQLQLKLHGTCFRGTAYKRYFQGKIQNHGKLTPLQFAHVMQSVHLVIGFGKPLDSPTAFDAVANGAVFLNPITTTTTTTWMNEASDTGMPKTAATTTTVVSQNDRLRELVGEPHVYDYSITVQETKHRNDTTAHTEQVINHKSNNLLETVQRALRHLPDNGFIAPEQDVCQLRQRVCRDLLEDDRMCQNAVRRDESPQERGHSSSSSTPMCLESCGKRIRGLSREQYQEDLVHIRDFVSRGDFDALNTISSWNNHSY